MDWTETTDENRKTLRRIVVLLLALAGLAERASGRSGAVCLLVLWLLRPGEAIARDYVAGLVGNAGCLPAPIRPGGDAAAEAVRLAASFRSLAAALSALAAVTAAPWQPNLAAVRSMSPAGPLATLRDPVAAPVVAVERLDSS